MTAHVWLKLHLVVSFIANLVNYQIQVATDILFKVLPEAFWYCVKCQPQHNFVTTKTETSIYIDFIILFALPK